MNAEDGTKAHGGAFERFDPRLSRWFISSIGQPTRLQRRAWGEISKGRSVLIVSATGTGKTLSALMPPVDSLVSGRIERSKVAVLYISPMKAMGADIARSLIRMSEGLGSFPGKKLRQRGRRRRDLASAPDAPLQVGMRTGDVPQSERRRLLSDPPDLLITTPENLTLMLFSRSRDILDRVRYVVIDEVHEMVPSKRGAMLSLALELLEDIVSAAGMTPPVRIGLSATVHPEDLTRRFIGGIDTSERARPVRLVKDVTEKRLSVELRTFVQDLDGSDDVEDAILKDIGAAIGKGRSEERADGPRTGENRKGSIVVFHNTRRKAEEMAFSLMDAGFNDVMAHHGSMGAAPRELAEEGLRSGKLGALISSTSLELGIDIGSIAQVCQISSPKDPSRMVQRFGRSGHGIGRTSRGILYPVNGPDVIECLAVAIAASKGQKRAVSVPQCPIDVLAQFSVGLAMIEENLDDRRIFRLARRAYPFRNLRSGAVSSIMTLLSEGLPGRSSVTPRLRREGENGPYRPRRHTRQSFYQNCGAIPKDTSIKVIEEGTNRMIGEISRDFGETLYERDVFLLGSRPFRIMRFSGTRMMVREDPSARPTVPFWSGEVLPRPALVFDHIQQIYEKGCGHGRGLGTRAVSIALDGPAKDICTKMVKEHNERGLAPGTDLLPVEEVKASRGKRMYIFHLPLGRGVTDPLSRMMAYNIRRSIGAMVEHTSTDDGFAISTPGELSVTEMREALSQSDPFRTLEDLIIGSATFKTRFSHCLSRSLLVLGRFQGRETGAFYRRTRLDRMLAEAWAIREKEGGWENAKGAYGGLSLLALEAVKEVMSERMDPNALERFLRKMGRGKVRIVFGTDGTGLSTLGRSIVQIWKGRLSDNDEVAPTKEDWAAFAPTEEATEHIGISGCAPGTKGPGQIFLEILESPSAADDRRLTLEALAEQEGASLETMELKAQALVLAGSMMRIDINGRTRYIPASAGAGSPRMTLSVEDIVRSRRGIKGAKASPKNVMRGCPFFTHPIEVATRSARVDLKALRASVKGGGLVPCRSMRGDRLADPHWAAVFRSLAPEPPSLPSGLLALLRSSERTSRAKIGGAAGSKGDDLTDIIKDLKEAQLIGEFPKEARDLIGAPDDILVLKRQGPAEDGGDGDGIRALSKFLRSFGPFTLNELASIFNWRPGSFHPALLKAARSGEVLIGPGPASLAVTSSKGNGPTELWAWWKGHGVDPRERIGAGAEKDDRISSRAVIALSGKDPALLLTGRAPTWTEKERVRNGNTVLFKVLAGAVTTAEATVVETPDMIRVLNVETNDFKRLEASTLALSEMLEAYSRLGFSAMMVESVMGVPAGEAAKRAIGPFIDMGFDVRTGPKGPVLVTGVEVIEGISREGLIATMMLHQGLLPGHHLSHPIEVISRLGGITDRWELLSRLGSNRYPRFDPLKWGEHASLLAGSWERFVVAVKNGIVPEMPDWSVLLENANESLPDLKDLAKRFSLVRGMTDQPGPVWTFMQELLSFPSPPRAHSKVTSELEKDAARSLSLLDAEGRVSVLRSRDLKPSVESLIERRMFAEDAWGSVMAPYRDGRYRPKRKPQRREVTRGLAQRAWVLRCACSLGAFTLEDMLNLAPDLDDTPKVRAILDDLCPSLLRRSLCFGAGLQPIYSLRSVPFNAIRDAGKDPVEGLTIISQKDRMARVLYADPGNIGMRPTGSLVMKGGRLIATISLKRAGGRTKNDPSETREGAWKMTNIRTVDRSGKAKVVRTVKKRLFLLGILAMSEEERSALGDLYREASWNDRSVGKAPKDR